MTSIQAASDAVHADAAAAASRTRAHLLSLQNAQGWWKGELRTNVTVEAQDLLMRQFLGLLTPGPQTQETARWIRSQQRPDGTWALSHDGVADLPATVEAYLALRLAGDTPGEPHMLAARDYVRSAGGLQSVRMFTRIWLAMFGLWPWDELPVLPPELILLPSRMPFNIYDWAAWTRQTLVPLTVVSALRPVRPLGFDLDELFTGDRPVPARFSSKGPAVLRRVGRILHRYEHRPIKVVRRSALRRVAEWIIARQDSDGSWGGMQPPWIFSLIALHLLGYPVEHPVLAAGLAGLDRYTIREHTPEGTLRRLEVSQSPVWETALTVAALTDSGLAPDAPALIRAADWLAGQQITDKDDWAVRRPHVAPGGWTLGFAGDPDTDDTAEVILALCRLRGPGQPAGTVVDRAVERGAAWLIGMETKGGGWGAFDADNTRQAGTKVPFWDFGTVIDPPSADVTAHVVEALVRAGRGDRTAVRRGVAWLQGAQEADGSWFGRWGANHVYGTGAVVPALVAAGVDPGDDVIRRAVTWLHEHQNDDGGWGEDLRSYTDPAWIGRGTSTASQTAWALLALLAAGDRSEPTRRGIAWLIATQRPDGTWDEPQFTGTGFPGDFYFNYGLYRLVFPLTALGRYVGDSA